MTSRNNGCFALSNWPKNVECGTITNIDQGLDEFISKGGHSLEVLVFE